MDAMTPTDGLIKACKDQAERCADSATTFMIYLRWLRFWDVVGSVVTVVLGAIATWKIVAQSSPVIAATCAFLTTVIPLTMRAMRIPSQSGNILWPQANIRICAT